MLQTEQLKRKLKAIDPAQGDVVDRMVAALDEWIKTATVTVNVQTNVTGTCATPSGAGTIAGTGTGTCTGQIS